MPFRRYVLRRPHNKLGAHGQPTNRDWSAQRITDRSIDELIGLCKGMAADKILVEAECAALLGWLQANQHTLDTWPASILAARIDLFLEDGVIDDQERADLFQLLNDLIGQAKPLSNPDALAGESTDVNRATALPLTNPAPPVFFTDHRFCLTGRFLYGPRANVEYEIKDRGGIVQPTVTQATHYLVIGDIGSSDWLHSTHGLKIERAAALALDGHPIAIIPEEHWADHLL